MGLHSALAIKRQRRRREEQRKARERRYSSQSTESGLGESSSSCASPRNSFGSLDRKKHRSYRPQHRSGQSDKVVSSVGMLHIGVIFIVLGLFLIGSGLIPDDLDNWSKGYTWFNELVVSGFASFLVGVFLIILNKVITNREEKDLAEYVSRQLTRSKSGHRLVRDVETGNLVCKQNKNKSEERINILESEMNGEITPVHFSPTLKSPPALSVSTPRSDLERILEEELSDKGDEGKFGREIITSQHQDLSRELIAARYYNTLDIEK